MLGEDPTQMALGGNPMGGERWKKEGRGKGEE